MSKRNIMIKIGKQLDICDACGNKPPSTMPHKKMMEICGPCETYERLRVLGISLNNFEKKGKKRMTKKRTPLKMNIEEYLSFRAQGLNDTQIAKEKDATPQQIYRWKKVRKNQLNPKECDCNKLENKLKEANKTIQGLEEEIAVKDVAIRNLNNSLNKLVSDKKAATELFETAMADKKNAHKENITLRNEIENIKNQINLIRSMRDDSFEQYKALERKAHAMQLLLFEYLSKDVS